MFSRPGRLHSNLHVSVSNEFVCRIGVLGTLARRNAPVDRVRCSIRRAPRRRRGLLVLPALDEFKCPNNARTPPWPPQPPRPTHETLG